MTNKASWIPAATAQVAVGDAEIYTPGPNELLVKVKSIAFSPIDGKIQKYGVHPIPYPNILGTSYAGTVEAVGAEVTGFKKGDNIANVRAGPAMADLKFGALQQYALAAPSSTTKLHPSTPLHAASATILNLSATVSALSIHLGLERPPLEGKATPKGTKVLIYGGSSSTGGLAIKYAVSAGYDVVTTSSPAHRDFVQSLGPSHIIDHTLPADKVIAELTAQGPYTSIFDTIGLPPVDAIVIGYLESIGGGSYNTLIPPLAGSRANELPENVKRVFAPYSFSFAEEANKPLASWLFQEYLPKGLASGLIVPTRQEVVPGGLEKVQEVLDQVLTGVSGKKLVLDPWA